ncbi:MAG: NAD/NADP octopine/nopaline dehydrogenase family protein [Proteocatella sp.]
MKKIKYAVIGAGNGGQATAGYLAAKGYEVRLFDFLEDNVSKLKKVGSIELSGALEMTGTPKLISGNMQEVIEGVDMVIVVNPSTYHGKIAAECSKFITENQVVLLHPASTFGAFAFKKALEDNGCHKKITIAETNTLLFACRATEMGKVMVGGVKDRLIAAAFPADQNDRIYELIGHAIPELVMGENVFVTSMDNTNPLVHPGPTLMNCNWAESGFKFKYYHDGIGETMGAFIEKMDRERIAIGEKMGLELGKNIYSMYMQYETEYDTVGANLSEVFKKVDAYDSIYASSNIRSRYIYEDVPTGLIPFVELGRLVGCKVDSMNMVVEMCCQVLDEDFWNKEESRTLAKLGLEGMSAEQIYEYAKTGKK